jgi:ADP-heptose:LPS heptosyltransferase
MRVDALRLLDRLIGIPLCWLLTLGRKAAALTGSRHGMAQPRRVLVVKLSEMGSTVLAYPALAELCRLTPGVELFFLVFKNNAAIMNALGLSRTENIITIDQSSPRRLLSTGLQALQRLRREQIDTTIDMDFFSRLTAITAFLVCRGNRVGFDRYNDEGLYRGDLLTHRVAYSPHIHTSAAFMALTRALFATEGGEPYFRGPIDDADLRVPRHAPRPEELSRVRGKLAAAGYNGGDTLILINPNSSDIFPLRKWPLRYFAELCVRIIKEFPRARLVITGVAAERADARFIQERVQSPRCVDFTGQTSFTELLALYGIADLMVTNDSGPAHFASLLSLPTIVLFGPETPRLYSPLGPAHHDVYANFACSPCVSVYNGKRSPCTDNRCLQSITVESVMAKVSGLLAGKQSSDCAAPPSL